VYVEPKLDGYRMAVCLSGKDSLVRCRKDENPSWQHNVQHIVRQLLGVKAFDNCMVDGELTGKSWGELSKLVRLKSPTKEQKQRILDEVNFTIFDVVQLRDSYAKAVVGGRGRKLIPYSNELHSDRRQRILEILFDSPTPYNLRCTAGERAESDDQVWKIYAKFVRQGFEGGMVKLDKPYFFDRTPYWLKIKPTKTMDLKVVEVVEGLGKHTGRMGALMAVSNNGDEIGVGTGFSDAQREDIWKRRKVIVGQHIEIRCQDDNVASARNPVFIRFRNDSNKEYVK
jgi:DNA ligase-1